MEGCDVYYVFIVCFDGVLDVVVDNDYIVLVLCIVWIYFVRVCWMVKDKFV